MLLDANKKRTDKKLTLYATPELVEKMKEWIRENPQPYGEKLSLSRLTKIAIIEFFDNHA